MSKRKGGSAPQAPSDAGTVAVMTVRPARMARVHRYLYTLGLYGFWRKRDTSVVTPDELLLGRGIFNREERCIPLDRVEDARFQRRWFNSYTQLTVSERGRFRQERLGPFSARTARQVTREIRKRIKGRA